MDFEQLHIFDSEHTLVWALLMLQAMNKSGIAPCDNRTFHRLIYFGNTLAHLYDFQPPAEIVMRHPRGPFYPRAQVDLDRLCVMQLVKVSGFKLQQNGQIVERLGTYDILPSGFACADKLRRNVQWAYSASSFLLDLSVAFASVNVGADSRSESKDPTYQSRSTEEFPVINFSKFRRNLSLRVARELESRFPNDLRPVPQHLLRLYVRYLEMLAA